MKINTNLNEKRKKIVSANPCSDPDMYNFKLKKITNTEMEKSKVGSYVRALCGTIALIDVAESERKSDREREGQTVRKKDRG